MAEVAIRAVFKLHQIDFLALISLGNAKVDDHAAYTGRDNQAFLVVDTRHAAIVKEIFRGENHIANYVLDFVHDPRPERQPAPASARPVDQTSGVHR